MKTLLLKLPNLIPPSYNKCLQIIYSLKYIELSREAKHFKYQVKQFMPIWVREPSELPLDRCYFKVSIGICQDWFCKKGTLKKQDISNLDKLIIDAVFEKLGVDDSRVIHMGIYKIQSTTEVNTSVEVIALEQWI